MSDKLLQNSKLLSKKSQQVYNHVQDNRNNINVEYIKNNLLLVEEFVASTRIYLIEHVNHQHES